MTTTLARFGRCTAALLGLAALLVAPAAAQAPAWQWGLQTTNPGPTDGSAANGEAVAVDAAGRVYVVGSLLSNGPSSRSLSRSFGSAGSLTGTQKTFVAQASAAGQWTWVLPVVAAGGGPNQPAQAHISAVTATPGGAVYAAGVATGDSLLVGTRYYPLPTPTGVAFVLRLDNTGAVQWLRSFATTGSGYQLAPDPSTGGVVLAGAYQGTPTIGTTTLPPGMPRFEGSPFVARLDAGGSWRGVVSVNGTSSVGPEFTMSVGPAGQVALVGSQFDGVLTFGGAFSLSVLSPTGRRAFVAQLNPNNTWGWAVGGTTGNSNAYGAAYTPTGTLWVGGNGADGAVVGSLTLALPNSVIYTSQAGYVVQFSAAGQPLTGQQLAPLNEGYCVVALLRTDAAGNVLALGGVRGPNGPAQTTIGTRVLTAPSDGILLFVVGMNPGGQWRYVAPVPNSATPDGLEPVALALDNSGGLCLVGNLYDRADFGPFALTGTTSPGSSFRQGNDLFLAKLANATALAARPAAAAPALACYPNPAHGTATLRLPAPTETTAPARVFDALGREVRRCPVPARAAEVALDLSDLAPGLYLVRCGAAVGRLVVE